MTESEFYGQSYLFSKSQQNYNHFLYLIKSILNSSVASQKYKMLISTVLKYAARKVKVNLTGTEKTISQQAKTKFSDDEILEMAGFKENARSTVKMFRQKIQQKAKTNYQSQNPQQTQQDDLQDNYSYEKKMKKPKHAYDKFKYPHTPYSERITAQQITLKQLSRIRLQPQYLPPHFMQRVKKVFHKYSQSQLREITEHFAVYTKLRYSQQKIDYESYEDLGFQKLQYKPLQGGPAKQETIYLTGRDKIYQNKQDEEKARKADEDPLQNDISYTQNLVVSYLLLRMPKTYAVAVRVLTQIKYKFNNFKPQSFIDFGAGLSSGSLAYLDIFGDQSQEVYAVQPSPKMRKMSQYLIPDKIEYYKSLGELSTKVKSADIVYAGYVLNQISPQLMQVYLQSLWAKVKNQGFLVFAEHGNPFGARTIHQTRKWILNKTNASIAAPCPHHMKCPLARSKQWCHFDQPSGMYPKQVFGKLPNDNQLKNQKFTYLIIQKTLTDQYQEEITSNVTKQWDRIIFPLIKRGGHFGFNVCTKKGTFERRIIAKSHGDEYKQGRKLRWGDLWRFGKRIPNKFRKQRGTGKRLW